MSLPPVLTPDRGSHTGRRRALVMALLALGGGASCDLVGPPREDGVRSVAITLESTILRPGESVVARAEPLDRYGLPIVGLSVAWRSLTPATLDVSTAGEVVALAPGIGRLRASVSGVSAEVELSLVNPPTFTLAVDPDTLRLLLPLETKALTAVARDAEGLPIIRPPLAWESSASQIADVGTDGRVRAASAGIAHVITYSDERADTTVVIVSAPTSPNAPQIVSTAPLLALPGQSITVTGSGFASTVAGNQVRINGTSVTVEAASPSQLTLRLPPATQFACTATGPVALQVTTNAGIGVGTVELRMAPQRSLAPGQSIVVPGGLESRCVELSPASGRYVITAQNTARVLNGPAAFSVQGVASIANGSLLSAPVATVESRETRSAVPRAGPRAGPRATRRQRAHAALLAANAARDNTASVRMAALTVPVLGSLQPIRIPNLEATSNLCDSYIEVGTRTAYVGPHLAILEDTAPTLGGLPTLRGQLDDLYAEIGADFEAATWPTLAVFGNVLVRDERLDNNGRIVLVVTPRMNQLLGGSLLAATTTCDFRQRQLAPASNVGEYIYAQVPMSLDAGMAPGTRTRWMWEIRGTIAHEAKHVVSYAERIDLGFVHEEPWLEEATARHAEELYARAVYGTQLRGNHGFNATLRCETHFDEVVPPADCIGKPRAMTPHFEGLWDFLDTPGVRSPLGPYTPGDFSYYGASWALTRWMLDHSGLSEPTFFQSLTRSLSTGIANLEARVGRSWPDLLGEWSLAMATDDFPGLNPEAPRISFLSWNLPSVFLGLCEQLGPCVDPVTTPSLYPRAHPLQLARLRVGGFAAEFPEVRAGGFGAMELAGGNSNRRQLLSLRGYRGAPLPPDARMSIIRVE